MRTTVDLDDSVLRELKRLQKRERKALGRLASDLIAQALAARKASTAAAGPEPFAWISRPMGARVDLADKDAVHALLDQPEGKADRKGARS
jgi:hypothetical protein